jgi:hypothetical protein
MTGSVKAKMSAVGHEGATFASRRVDGRLHARFDGIALRRGQDGPFRERARVVGYLS